MPSVDSRLASTMSRARSISRPVRVSIGRPSRGTAPTFANCSSTTRTLLIRCASVTGLSQRGGSHVACFPRSVLQPAAERSGSSGRTSSA
eukprot:365535-Chlamydomonas_euryale.AAC.99